MSNRVSQATAVMALVAMMVGLIASGCTNSDTGVADAKGGVSPQSQAAVPLGGPGTSPDTQAQIRAAEQASGADRSAHAPQHPKTK